MNKYLIGMTLLSTTAVGGEFLPTPVIDMDFEKGSRLDSSDWTRTIGVNNNTTVFYTDGGHNLSYSEGVLTLEIRNERIANPKYKKEGAGSIRDIPFRELSSASLATRKYYKYGKFEIVAKVPEAAGVQPAIWLQGQNKGQYGEIDIMEVPGIKKPGYRFATIHAGVSPKELDRKSGSAKLDNAFHTYTAEWTPSSVRIFYDGNQILDVPSSFGDNGSISPLNQPMQLKINIGAGTGWSGSVDSAQLPQRMQVKSIKVWEYSGE